MKHQKLLIIIILSIFIIYPINVYAGRGCCSWHGGQNYCGSNNRWICSDGWESSCSCFNDNSYNYEESYAEDKNVLLLWVVILFLPACMVFTYIKAHINLLIEKIKQKNNKEICILIVVIMMISLLLLLLMLLE